MRLPFVVAVLLYTMIAGAQVIPNTGQQITPMAPAGAQFEPLNPELAADPKFLAGQAVTSIVSPDGRTLLVLTSGYNLLDSTPGSMTAASSSEFIFAYDISQGMPVKKQVIQVRNSYSGIVFDPSGEAFYVSGGVDDNVHAYALANDGKWQEQAGSPISLGHGGVGVGLAMKPQAAGIAISRDGAKLVVANYYNDSVSILSKTESGWKITGEFDLRPGKNDPKQSGVPGGEYPLWVVIKGDDTAYVSSIRDREIVVVNFADKARITTRIAVPGQPNRMALNRSQSTLYVAEDNNDSVAVIDAKSNRVTENIPVTAPVGLLPSTRAKLKGNDTNSVTLSPDEKFLYVTNGWMNDVAVVQLSQTTLRSHVVGLIPTGWYPNSISFSADGKFTYVVNGKSPTGPNPGHCSEDKSQRKSPCSPNQYNLQLIKAGLQSFPMPGPDELQSLTRQVAANNHFKTALSASERAKLAFLRAHVKHVIYIIKENRTYDQVLGDLEVGNGDPELTEFPEATTPNQHKLARDFVTLDNFYDTSEVSYDGWSWSTAGRAPDLVEKQAPIHYAGRGLSYDSEGTNRDINVAIGSLKERREANPRTPDDPDDLPGTANVAAPDSDEGERGTGYLWNSALRKGLTVRNYGFFIDLARYDMWPEAMTKPYQIPLLLDPAATKTQVAYPADKALAKYTDIYFRSFDNAFPDFYRYKEWEREFDAKYAAGGLPNLSLVRFMHDHTGSFGEAILGVNTPELQVADNDYAVGLLVQKIGSSRYKNDTLIFVIEDDSQSGADHVDSHRSIAFVVGPYVKHKAVVSASYTTIGMLRTIEEVLGIGSTNLNDASAKPMTDVFDLKQREWNYTAVPSGMLAGTQLPVPKKSGLQIPWPTHDASYWAEVTRGMDFSVEDRVDPLAFNHVLWKGMMSDKPYPAAASGDDLREHRKELLDAFRARSQGQ